MFAVRVRCLAVAVVVALGSSLLAAHKDRHVVVISIDGFPAMSWRDPSLPLPVLRGLAAQGAAADAMTTSNPAITWPCHTTLVTGVTPEKHGVLFNGLLVRQGPNVPPKIEPWVEKAKLVRVPTIYDAAPAAGLTTAESDWVANTRPGTITWSFAELPDPNGQVAQDMIAAGEVTAEDIRLMQAGPERRKVLWRDEIWTKATCFMIRRYRPNLVLHHTLNTDSTHHRYGPGTEPGYTALAHADRLVSDVVRAVDDAGLRAKTTFFIVTDHGFKKVTHYVSPNVMLKQAGLIKAAGPSVTHCDAWTMPQGGIAFVYIMDPVRKAELLPKLKELFRGAAAIERVIDASEANALGMPTPAQNQGMGDLILYPKAGYAFNASVIGEAATTPTTNYGGTHGYNNADPELDGLFIASGAGIKAGARLPRVRNLDLAPTIARLLGVELPNTEGRVLEEILEPVK